MNTNTELLELDDEELDAVEGGFTSRRLHI